MFTPNYKHPKVPGTTNWKLKPQIDVYRLPQYIFFSNDSENSYEDDLKYPPDMLFSFNIHQCMYMYIVYIIDR